MNPSVRDTTAADPARDTGPPTSSRGPEGLLTRGLAAGLAGAVAMALWFLLVDGSQGEPFRTPALIASGLLGLESVETGLGVVALYTLIHVAAWCAVGVALAWMLERIPVASPLLLGLALGFGLFDAVFYGSVAVTGVDVVGNLGWPPVLVGNVLAGVVLLAVLHVTDRSRRPTWWENLSDNRVVREGILAGILGAVVVAAWFLVVDVVRGQVLFTPGALGSAFFLGADSVAEIQVGLATVLGYTVLHLTAFVVVGFVAAGLFAAADDAPPLILAALMLFVSFAAFFLGALAMLSEFLLGTLAWWSIAVGTALAAAAMGGYLWRRHPRLRSALSAGPLHRDD